MSLILPVTLSSAAAAAILAIWLMIRVGQVRMSEKVDVGDGGNEKVIRRMRAHANFVENAPFALALIGAIEITGKGEPWLAYVAAIFFVARILHALGMDGGALGKGRPIGIVLSMLTLLGLAICAMLILLGVL